MMVILLPLLFGAILLIASSTTRKDDVLFLKQSSQSINGFFVIMVFLSHFRTYISLKSVTEIFANKLFYEISQLMVAPFLFFSGYGIMTSISKIDNNKKYVHKMIQRLWNVWASFVLAIVIYYLMGLVYGDPVTLPKLLLSFIAWESLGNSAWYMFAIFGLYVLTITSLMITEDRKKFIWIVALKTIVLFLVLRLFKASHWYNTLLCYPFGMWVKENETKILFGLSRNFLKVAMFVLLSIVLLRTVNDKETMLYSLYAISILSLMTLVSYKISFDSKILIYINKYIFEIYIYQRLFFRIFSNFDLNKYVYLIISFVCTLLLSIIVQQIRDHFKKEKHVKRKYVY